MEILGTLSIDMKNRYVHYIDVNIIKDNITPIVKNSKVVTTKLKS